MKTAILFFGILFAALSVHAQTSTSQIQQIIEKSYIEGIYTKGDAAAIQAGWHESAEILICDNGDILRNPVTFWIEYFSSNSAIAPDITYNFENINIAGNAAVAELSLFRNNVLFSTDFISLHRFADGWKIVSKISDNPQAETQLAVSKVL